MFFLHPRRGTLIILLSLVTAAAVAQPDIPVDHYSGTPIITIPLYTVNDRSLSHSISLIYTAGGVKVDDKASSVGTSWSLITGGEVRRELRGLPDDYYSNTGPDSRKGWLHNSNASTIGSHTYLADGSALSCANESSEYTFVNGLGFNADTEPDIFSFDAGEISGSFVFDNTGSITGIKLIPYQDVTVIAHRASSTALIDAFTIISANGTKYYFSNGEYITRQATRPGSTAPFFFEREYQQYKTSLSYGGAWKLTSITSAVGEVINFGYTQPTNVYGGGKVKLYPYDLTAFYEQEEYEIVETLQRRHVSSITTPHQSIAFYTSESPHSTDNVMLQRITVNSINENTSVFIKSINFTYDYAVSSVPDEPAVDRMFLKSILVDDACEVSEPYVFTYEGITESTPGIREILIANAGSVKKDIWGFYLNHAGTTAIPTIYINPALTGYDRINLFQKSIANEITVAGSAMISSSTPQDGVLTSIRYPSGAKAFFEYEPHQFHNPVTNSTMTGGGLRIRRITLRDGLDRRNDIVKSYQYLNSSSATSGKLLTLPVFWQLAGAHRRYNGTVTQFGSLTGTTEEKWKKVLLRFDKNINPDFDRMPTVGYEYVTEKISTGQGKTVFQFEVPNTFGTTTATDFSLAYTHIARASGCPSPAYLLPGYFESPSAPQTPFNYARGLLLKSSQFIEGESTPIREVVNSFSTTSINTATIKGLRYDRTYYSSSAYFYTYSDYTLVSNKTKVLTGSTVRNRDRDNSGVYHETVSAYTYGANHAMITRQVVTNSDGTELISNTKYVKDYPVLTTTAGDTQVALIDALADAGIGGMVIEKTEGVKRTGESEYTMSGTLAMLYNFGTTPNPVILPKEIHTVPASGITGFALSSFNTVSGTTTFVKNASYRKMVTNQFRAKGDAEFAEDKARQKQAYHVDNRTGFPIATFDNTEANAVVYANFDQNTDFDFDQYGFGSGDNFAAGRTGSYGLGGWRQSAGKYLKKALQKKAGEKYVFSAWYKAPEAIASPGDHSFSILIKNTSGTTLITRALNFQAPVAGSWYYAEEVLDLSSTPSDIVVELHFNDTYASSGSGILDEVLFKPESTTLVRSTLHTGFGVVASVAPDGRIAKQEYDASGRPRYLRDHDDNIVQKTIHTRWSGTASSPSPISIQVPATIYDNHEIVMKALTGCLDIATLQWKVELQGGPAGTFFNGSDEEPYTFSAGGNYTITLKVTHATYGTYTKTIPVTVALYPLDVAICISAGPIVLDLCYPYYEGHMEFELDCASTTSGVYASTTFNATVSGCTSGATYTYQWQKRELPTGNWMVIGTNSSSVSVNNVGSAYEVRCYVTSSCGRVGTSGLRGVYLYRSVPGCLASAGEPPEGGGEGEDDGGGGE